MLFFLALGKLRQEDVCEFETIFLLLPSRKKCCLWMISENVYSGLGPGVSWASGLGSCVWVCGFTFVWGWVCLDKHTE